MIAISELKNMKLLLAIFLSCVHGGGGAKILFFIGGLTSHSHRASIQPLANRLAEKGHEVTYHTPLVMSKSQVNSNITQFCGHRLEEFLAAFQDEYGVAGLKVRVENKFTNDMFKHPTAIFDWSYLMSESMLRDPEFLEWVDRSQFDLIIVDSGMNEFVFGLSYYFKAKVIIYGSVGGTLMWDVGTFAVPPEFSWIPAYDSMYQGAMGFFDRLYNAYLTYRWTWFYQSYHVHNTDRLLRETMGHRVKGMPKLEQLIRNTSLMLVNQHYSDQFPRPFPAFIIPVGGMHVEEANGTLPKEIEEFVRGGGDPGFIYVSFGSIVRISTMPAWLLQVFLDVMKTSKFRFLWKWEGPIPANASSNVFFQKWFPQQNVLAHERALGFIMQGGQVSIQQANCNGVPLILFPVNGDQDFSAKRLRAIGNGIEMEFAGLTRTELSKAISDIIHVPRYREKSRELARACRDRPQKPLDTAEWWVEYVLRTPDTNLLKPESMGQPLWIYWNLDIWGFLFTLALISILSVALALVFFFRICASFINNSEIKNMKQKYS